VGFVGVVLDDLITAFLRPEITVFERFCSVVIDSALFLLALGGLLFVPMAGAFRGAVNLVSSRSAKPFFEDRETAA
jgi:hypothetical protein